MFCKIIESPIYGQILIVKGREISRYNQIPAIGITFEFSENLVYFEFGYKDTPGGWQEMEDRFNSIDESEAESIVRNILGE